MLTGRFGRISVRSHHRNRPRCNARPAFSHNCLSNVKYFAPFRLDVPGRALWRDDVRVPLTHKAFDVLAVAKRLKAEGKDVIELQIGDSPFPSTASARAAG